MSEQSAITLAHISDVHLPPVLSWKPWLWNLKRSVGLLNWYRNRRDLHLASVAAMLAADIVAQRPDHIAVTGDLASLGLPGEFQVGLDWVETMGGAPDVSVIPGNHDIYTKGCDAACLTAWADHMTSDAWGLELLRGETGFPYLRRIGNVALVGLNSSVPTRLFRASGRIGERQMRALDALLAKLATLDLVRVILIHHPPLKHQAPSRRALEDAKPLEMLLTARGADLVLHGHNHRDSLAWTRTSEGQPIPIVGVATGSTGREHRHEPLARYNLYRISGRRGAAHIEMTTRGLTSSARVIGDLRHQTLRPDAPLAASGLVVAVP